MAGKEAARAGKGHILALLFTTSSPVFGMLATSSFPDIHDWTCLLRSRLSHLAVLVCVCESECTVVSQTDRPTLRFSQLCVVLNIVSDSAYFTSLMHVLLCVVCFLWFVRCEWFYSYCLVIFARLSSTEI